MAKRSGSIFNSMAKNIAKTQREAEAARKRAERERVAAERQAERARSLGQKEARQRYLEERSASVVDQNQELAFRIEELRSILQHTLTVNDTISFASLRLQAEVPTFAPPQDLLTAIKPPSKLTSFIPGVQKEYAEAEAKRKAQLDRLTAEYERNKQQIQQQVAVRNKEVDELEAAYRSGDEEAVKEYCAMVLERSQYPEGFPQDYRLAYQPESKELVIDYQLPTVDIIPTTLEYRYTKTKDAIDEKPRKPAEIKDLYQDIVAMVCLRTIHEVFEADQGNHLEVVVFNGYVDTIDPATGRDQRPYLISVRATKEYFQGLNLGRIDKRACLRNLGAQVSAQPDEMVAVKPVVEFNMVDKRFVEQSDVLSGLDARPNLMELSPNEFEHLVSNLFQRMGLETKLTRASKDGGVDAVAFDTRPVLGGKVVIQAKRYKNTVDVSAVRDLYGTMMNEGANKGVLVTTRGFGPDAYQFAKDKPIELINGAALLFLLEEHAGIKARIIFADE